jgi:hypothetical protein
MLAGILRGLLAGAPTVALAVSLQAQEAGKLNVTISPPPPPEMPPAELPIQPRTLPLLVPEMLPHIEGSVQIPAGTAFDVILHTPLSTRISQVGQEVEFRTTAAVPLSEGLALPEETIFRGRVVSLQKPGGFSKQGKMYVDVRELDLENGAVAQVAARLEAADPAAYGGGRTDRNRAADIFELAQWTLMGTVIGREAKGGKGAAVGAGIGATLALILLSSKRGTDMYLEPGTPFRVVLEKPVELSAAKVYAAQRAAARARQDWGANQSSDRSESSASAPEPNEEDVVVQDRSRPKLKRRPKTAKP